MIDLVKRAASFARASGPVRPLFALLACAVLEGAGLLVLALRWVPLSFAYRPSDLGIVSVASLEQYPAQQELWYAAAACALPLAFACGLLALAMMRAARASDEAGSFAQALARGARVAPAMIAPLAWVLFVQWPGRLEALAWFSGPVALVIFFPKPGASGARVEPGPRLQRLLARDLPFAVLAGVGAAVGAFLSVALIGRATGPSPAACALAGALAGAALEVVITRVIGAGRSTRVARALAPLCLLLAYPYVAPLGCPPIEFGGAVLFGCALSARLLPFSPGSAATLVALAWAFAAAIDPSTVQRLVPGFADLEVLDVGYTVLSEHGQRLEWADRWIAGEVPGRDFLFLYGPLMLEAIRASWAALGRSQGALLLGFQVQDLLGILCVLACARQMLRTRTFALVALASTVPLYLRSGIGGLTLLLVSAESPLSWLAAGMSLGVAALYSHEFAVAQLIAGVVMLAYPGTPRRGLASALWAAGAAAVVLPYAAYLHAHGALGPMLTSMVEYPRLMLAGFGKLPYPSLTSVLPLVREPAVFLPVWSAMGRSLVGFYVLPMFYVMGAAWLVARRVAGVAVTRRERLVAGVVVFGLVAFRAGLGHSCLGHQEAILWPAVLIAAFLAERSGLRARPVVALALLAALPLFLHVKPVWQRFDQAWGGWERGKIHGCTGLLYEWVARGGTRAGELARVVRAVKAGTPAGAPLLALPNGSAYHFYTGRPNPTRFAAFSMMITREHRQEAVRALSARPPACVLYDLATPRLDNIPDRLQLSELLEWVAARYEVREVIGSTLLLYPVTSAGTPAGTSAGTSPGTSPGEPSAGEVAFGSPEELAGRLATGPVRTPFRLRWRP